jgi:hypothetical protein
MTTSEKDKTQKRQKRAVWTVTNPTQFQGVDDDQTTTSAKGK